MENKIGGHIGEFHNTVSLPYNRDHKDIHLKKNYRFRQWGG